MSIHRNERSSRRFAHSYRENEHDDKDTVGNWYFCFGDSASINSFLKNKTGCLWILPKFLNALFRGIGQVVFANNPFSGIVILTGIFWYNLTVGLLVSGSICIAILTAVVFNIQPKSIIAGLVTFNAVLLSSVASSLWTSTYNEPLSPNVYTFIAIGSVFSVLISNGLSNVLSSIKPSIPILSIPFHILAFVTFASLKPPSTELTQEEPISNSSLNSPFQLLNEGGILLPDTANLFASFNGTESDFYTWEHLQNTLLGVALSSGQVFGIADFYTSLLVYAAILLCSPMLALMCLHGAAIGTILGLFLTSFPNEEVYLGVWGFNGFLSCGAVGAFYVFNFYAFLNGTANAVFTAILQYALNPCFKSHNIPVFGLPFILSTIMFVCATSNGPQLVRVKAVTFPEKQRRSYYLKLQNEHSEDLAERGLLNV